MWGMGDRTGLQQPLSRAGTWGCGATLGAQGCGQPLPGMNEAVWVSLDVSAGYSAGPGVEDAACQVRGAMAGDVCAVRGSIWFQHPLVALA